MGALEENTTLVYGVHIRESANDGSDFTNAATDYRVLFLGEDGELHKKDSAGAVTGFAGTGIAATLADNAGDILVASGADAWAKLAMGSAGGHVSRINGAVAWDSGTSNPGSAAAGDRFWRTDLGLAIYYDGTRWVTVNQYRADSQMASGISANTVVGRLTPHHTTYDLWLDTFLTTTITGATTDGSNYWTIALRKLTGALSVTTITSFNTDADTDDNYVTRAVSIAAAMGTSNKAMDILATKVSNPGNLTGGFSVLYRLIVT